MIATLNDRGLTSAHISLPYSGAWVAECVIVDGEALEIGAQTTLEVGTLTLRGAVQASGAWGDSTRVRVIAGAAGSSRECSPRAYHSDAGVSAREVLTDAARDSGETLAGALDVPSPGIDYVRDRGPASRVFDAVAGPRGWWHDVSGEVRFETRPRVECRVDVLDVDPRDRVIELSTDDLGALLPGAALVSPALEGEWVADDVTIDVDATSLRARVSCVAAGTRGLSALLRTLVQIELRALLLGAHRYRVVRVMGERLELQPVGADPALPPVVAVSIWPGSAGLTVTPRLGVECLVEFVGGQRSQPVVTGFVHATPADELVAAVDSALRLGGASASSAVALAPEVDARLNLITNALNAYAGATPIGYDGGMALQNALKGVWGASRPSVDTGAGKVFAE